MSVTFGGPKLKGAAKSSDFVNIGGEGYNDVVICRVRVPNLSRPAERVVEKAARIQIYFASACPNTALFRMLAVHPITSNTGPTARRTAA